MHGSEREGAGNTSSDSDSPTPVVASLSVVPKVAALALATRIFHTILLPLSIEWQLPFEILAILSMILGNLVATTQTSMKRMLAYSSISQIGYILIGVITGDLRNGYTSVITYMLIHIFMNLGAFACTTLFGLRTGTDNIRDYAGLYRRDPILAISLTLCLLSLGGIPPLAGFYGKLYLFWCGWKTGLYLLVSIALITSVVSLYYYSKIIQLLLTGQGKRRTFYTEAYKISSYSLTLNNALETSIILCALASATLGIFLDSIVSIVESTII